MAGANRDVRQRIWPGAPNRLRRAAMKLAPIVAILAAAAVAAAALPSAAAAQTRSIRDTATAYGARMTSKGQPAALNQNRINSRVNNRIDNRLSLRIERYRPDSTANPTAAFQTKPDDKSRTAPVIAPPQPGTDEPE